MGNNELVTVVIPCYNYGQFLGEAIDSVLQQPDQALEVIVVDDGSSDNTSEVSSYYKKSHDNIQYIYQRNQGPSAARNSGIAASHGKYIVFLDADDRMKKSFLAKCLRVMQQNPTVSFVYTQMEYFGRESKISEFTDYNLEMLKCDNFINASALFRRNVFDDLLYDRRLRSGLEDWDVYLALASRGMHGKLLNEPLLLYRKHDAGVVSMTDRMQKQSLYLHAKLRIQLKHIGLVGFQNFLKTVNQYQSYKLTQAKTFVKKIVKRREE